MRPTKKDHPTKREVVALLVGQSIQWRGNIGIVKCVGENLHRTEKNSCCHIALCDGVQISCAHETCRQVRAGYERFIEAEFAQMSRCPILEVAS
jgi:hypothetical protein